MRKARAAAFPWRNLVIKPQPYAAYGGRFVLVEHSRMDGDGSCCGEHAERTVNGAYYDGLGYGILREEWEARYPRGMASYLQEQHQQSAWHPLQAC